MAFLITFLISYALLHLYVLKGFGTLFRFPFPFYLTFLLLYLSPLFSHWALKKGLLKMGQILYITGFTWMAFLFLSGCVFLTLDLLRLFYPLERKAGGFVALFFSLCALSYGFFEAQRPQVKTLTIKSPKILRAITIGVISDLHCGPVVKGERLKRLLYPLMEVKPDLILSPGDLLDSEPWDDLSSLRELKAPLGKFTVLGNHEGYMGPDKAQRLLEEMGFKVLRNERIKVGQITLIGVDDPHVRGKLADEKALLKKEGFVILLKHRPSPPKEGKFDLQLSGHTHGGQIFPFNLFVKFFYPKTEGLKPLKGGGLLYVTRGTGTWGPPVRFLVPPEVTIIKLEDSA